MENIRIEENKTEINNKIVNNRIIKKFVNEEKGIQNKEKNKKPDMNTINLNENKSKNKLKEYKGTKSKGIQFYPFEN